MPSDDNQTRYISNSPLKDTMFVRWHSRASFDYTNIYNHTQSTENSTSS